MTVSEPACPVRKFLRASAVEVGKALAITVVVGLAATAFNAVRGKERGGIDFIARAPYELFAPCPDADPSIRSVPAAAVDHTDPGVLVVDARTATEFVEGHIPGALPMPMYGHRPNVVRALPAVVADRGRQVLFYGPGADSEARRLATWLRTYLRPHSLQNLWVMEGGFAAWKAAGRPIRSMEVRAADPGALVRSPGDAVFVDARDDGPYAEGHIPGARLLPCSPLAPPDPSSYASLLDEPRLVVAYGMEQFDEELADVTEAAGPVDRGRHLAAVLLAMGARNVAWLPGGLLAWESAGGKVERGVQAGEGVR